MNGSWTRIAALLMLGLMEIGSWPQVAEAAELRHGVSSVTSVKASARMTSVSGLRVHTFTDTESMGAVTLHAYGTASDGRWAERRLTLPKSYRIEKEPYMEAVLEPATGSTDRYYRILYNFRGQDRIAGVAWYYGNPALPPETWHFHRAELTNVGWGYDLEKREFWIHPNPTDMPPVPIVVREEADWKGRLVAIPVELEYFDRRRANEIIEYWGGHVAGPGELPEIVLLPDDIDFAWARNRDAEAWVRRGAKVLWETNFPYPGVGGRITRRPTSAASLMLQQERSGRGAASKMSETSKNGSRKPF